jgi:hypothetical protein
MPIASRIDRRYRATLPQSVMLQKSASVEDWVPVGWRRERYYMAPPAIGRRRHPYFGGACGVMPS